MFEKGSDSMNYITSITKEEILKIIMEHYMMASMNHQMLLDDKRYEYYSGRFDEIFELRKELKIYEKEEQRYGKYK